MDWVERSWRTAVGPAPRMSSRSSFIVVLQESAWLVSHTMYNKVYGSVSFLLGLSDEFGMVHEMNWCDWFGFCLFCGVLGLEWGDGAFDSTY